MNLWIHFWYDEAAPNPTYVIIMGTICVWLCHTQLFSTQPFQHQLSQGTFHTLLLHAAHLNSIYIYIYATTLRWPSSTSVLWKILASTQPTPTHINGFLFNTCVDVVYVSCCLCRQLQPGLWHHMGWWQGQDTQQWTASHPLPWQGLWLWLPVQEWISVWEDWHAAETCAW